jgi:hypothetical protein
MLRSAAASFAWLFDTHMSGRMGSPTVAGSSKRCRCYQRREYDLRAAA